MWVNPHGTSLLGKSEAFAKLVLLSHLKWVYQFTSGCTKAQRYTLLRTLGGQQRV